MNYHGTANKNIIRLAQKVSPFILEYIFLIVGVFIQPYQYKSLNYCFTKISYLKFGSADQPHRMKQTYLSCLKLISENQDLK